MNKTTTLALVAVLLGVAVWLAVGAGRATDPTRRADVPGTVDAQGEDPASDTVTPNAPTGTEVSERIGVLGPMPAVEERPASDSTAWPVDSPDRVRRRVVTEAGAPIHPVTVVAESYGLESHELVNREDGSFELPFDRERPQAIFVALSAERFVSQKVMVRTADENGDIVLMPGAVLRGRLVDPEGQGLEGVHLQIFPRRDGELQGGWPKLQPGSVTTGPDGEFVSDPQHVGRALLRLSSRTHYLRGDPEIDVGVDLELELVAELRGVVRGVVRDEAGCPVPRVQVGAEWAAGASADELGAAVGHLTRTDEEGRFDLPRWRTVDAPAAGERIRCVLSTRGFGHDRLEYELVRSDVVGWGAEDVQVVVRPVRPLVVTALDATTGAPLDSIRISCTADPAFEWQAPRSLGEGRFELRRIEPRSMWISVMASKRAYLPSPMIDWDCGGDPIRPLTVRLEPVSVGFVRVVDAASGDPVPDARVQLVRSPAGQIPWASLDYYGKGSMRYPFIEGRGAVLDSSVTGADGRAALRASPGATHALVLSPQHIGNAARCTTADVAEGLVVRVHRGGRVEVQANLGWAGILAHLERPGSGRPGVATTSGWQDWHHGRFVFANVPAGKWSVVFTHAKESLLEVVLPIEVTPGESYRCEVDVSSLTPGSVDVTSLPELAGQARARLVRQNSKIVLERHIHGSSVAFASVLPGTYLVELHEGERVHTASEPVVVLSGQRVEHRPSAWTTGR